MKRRFLPAWQCDSDEDYYAQFDDRHTPDDYDDEEDNSEPIGDDCDYWKSNCYGRG